MTLTESTGMPPKKQTTKTGIAKAIGVKIADARAQRGRPQSQVAKAVGVVTQVVSHYEIGFCSPSIERLCMIASALDIEPRELMPSLMDLRSIARLAGRPMVTALKRVPVHPVQPLTPKEVCSVDVGRRIEERRVAAGLTQDQVAQRISEMSRTITRSAISQWENGQAMPMVDRLCEVAAALGCDPGELLTG